MNKLFENSFIFHIFGVPLLSFSYKQLCQKPDPETEATAPQALPAEASPQDGDGEPLFVINSLMLYRCFKLLTRTENEHLHAITGSVFHNARFLEHIVPLSLSRQSVGGAEAENESLANELMFINEFGLRPLAYFHSHPGFGANATCPSGTDRQTQATMEKSGSDIIGGIFSRDGFVRFYVNRGRLKVRVIGKRVRKVEKNVYQLEVEKDL